MDINSIISNCQSLEMPLKCYMRNDEEDSDILVFEKDGLYSDIEFYDSGVILAVVSDRENIPDVWRVDSIRHVDEALDKIKTFFKDGILRPGE